MSLLGPPWFNYRFSFTLAYSRISHEYSSLSLWLIWFLCFHVDALTDLGAFMRTEFLCISILGVASGHGVRFAGCERALGSRWFVLLAVLGRWSRCWSCSMLLCGLFCEAVCFVPCVVLFCYCVFWSFWRCGCLAWGGGGWRCGGGGWGWGRGGGRWQVAGRGAFRTFVRFALVWFYLFSVPLGVWEGCVL